MRHRAHSVYMTRANQAFLMRQVKVTNLGMYREDRGGTRQLLERADKRQGSLRNSMKFLESRTVLANQKKKNKKTEKEKLRVISFVKKFVRH